MDAIELCQRYFQAWMRRDAGAVLETMSPEGTYADPTTPGPLNGQAFRAYMQQLWAAFPDLSFELGPVTRASDSVVHGEWTMTGTNTGSLHGLPPTGAAVRVPGIDVIEAGSDGIRRVQGYFDSALLPRQLGLDVLVQPKQVGPVRLGSSSVLRRELPGVPQALVCTELVAADDAAVQRLREMSRGVLMEQAGDAGFLAFTGAVVGRHMTTFSAWSSVEHMQAAMRRGSHAEAMREFFRTPDIEGGSTMLFEAKRVGPFYRRCGACGRLARLATPQGTCECGAAVQAVA